MKQLNISALVYLITVHLSSKKAYKANVVLIGKIDPEVNSVEAWPFYMQTAMQTWENQGPSECVLLKIFHTKICDLVCSWGIAKRGKLFTMRKPFLVTCQHVSLVIAPWTMLWKNCNNFAKVVSVSEIPATSASCNTALPSSLSYWFSHLQCILYILE